MRKYTPKDSVQKQAYFSDRFFVSPPVPRLNPNEDEVFAKDFEEIPQLVSIGSAVERRSCTRS